MWRRAGCLLCCAGMGILDRLFRRPATRTGGAVAGDEERPRIPDPGRVPTRRGSWEEAALTNVDITEVVKRQIGTVTPPWKK